MVMLLSTDQRLLGTALQLLISQSASISKKNPNNFHVIHGAKSLSFRWHTFFFLSSLKHPFQELYPFWSRTTYTAKVITEQHCVPTFYSSRRICCTRPQRRKRGDTKRNVWCSVLTPTLWMWNVQVCLFTSVTPQLQDSI